MDIGLPNPSNKTTTEQRIQVIEASQQDLETSSLKDDNRLRDCVFIKLHSLPMQNEEMPSSPVISTIANPQTILTRQVGLKLTIRFGEQCIPVPGGKVRFGLQRGELKLKLEEHASMPIEKMGLTAKFTKEILIEMQHEHVGETEAHITVTGGVKNRFVDKKSSKTQYETFQYHTRGSETEPIWVFHAETAHPPILRGQLTEEQLGVVEIKTNKTALCCVKATFEVRGVRDLYLIESEGILRTKHLSRNKTALLTREFFKQFIEPKLQPYLSEVEVKL